MRGPFNTTVDVFCGPGSPTPGVLRGTFNCRLVPADGIFLVGVNSPPRWGWVTLEGLMPTGCFSAPELAMDQTLADLIAIPSGTTPQWYVLFSEEVFWRSQRIYWRANLVLLPHAHFDAIIQEDGFYILQENGNYILAE